MRPVAEETLQTRQRAPSFRQRPGRSNDSDPFDVSSRLFPVISRVSKGEQPEETSVRPACIKHYFAPSAGSAPNFDTLDDGGYETSEVRDVRRNGGGRGLCGGPGKRVDGVFPGRPQSFRHQRRPVDDCSPVRGGMAQNGITRGGTFHGKTDCCKENQGWTTACSGMP